MLKLCRYLTVLLLTLSATAARASEEGTVALSEFRMATADAPPLGRAIVSGKLSYPSFVSLEAEAFGRKYSVPAQQLAKLKGFSPNGLYLSQITAGAHSPTARLYLVLVSSFLSSPPERRYVVFMADGRIGIGSKP